MQQETLEQEYRSFMRNDIRKGQPLLRTLKNADGSIFAITKIEWCEPFEDAKNLQTIKKQNLMVTIEYHNSRFHKGGDTHVKTITIGTNDLGRYINIGLERFQVMAIGNSVILSSKGGSS